MNMIRVHRDYLRNLFTYIFVLVIAVIINQIIALQEGIDVGYIYVTTDGLVGSVRHKNIGFKVQQKKLYLQFL